MKRRKEILANAVLLFLSLNVALVGLELGLRMNYDDSATRTSGFKTCAGDGRGLAFHPNYGWTHNPDSAYIHSQSGPQTDDGHRLYTTNERGFRDTYNSGQKTAIVLGDSFTYGILADEGAQYPYLLDRWSANRSFRNYGVVGYGTGQELLVYRNVSDRVNHDLVVLGYYYGNDPKNNVGGGYPTGPRRPVFELRDGELVQTHEPINETPTPEVENEDDGNTSGLIQNIYSFVKGRSAAVRWLDKRISRIDRDENTIRNQPPDGKKLGHQMEMTEAFLNEVAKEADRHNATVVIVTIPSRGQIDPNNPAHYRPSEVEGYWGAQDETIQGVANNHSNVEVIRMKLRFDRVHKNRTRVYGQWNAHLDEEGHRVVATTVFEYLSEHGYVTPRSDERLSSTFHRNSTTCPNQDEIPTSP